MGLFVKDYNAKTYANKKTKKSISIPKIDFSNIFNQYYNNPFCIQEVKYISQFNNKEDNGNIESGGEKNSEKEISNNYYQINHHKKSIIKRN